MTLAVLLALALAQEAPQCSISGRVYNAATEAPLARASVHLGGRTVPDRDNGPATVTDAGGNFHFDKLAAGEYIAFAERNGFLGDAAPRLSCGATDVAIKLMPQAMIFGKVVDDQGEAVAGASVDVYSRGWLHGRRFLQIVYAMTSQADGTFVAGGMRAANYYLSAQGTAHAPPGEAFVANYYPDTPDPQSAAPVAVTAGSAVRGVELRVRTAPFYTVRGSIVGDVAAAAIMMMHASEMGAAGSTTIDVNKGAFEFRGVAPGDYVLMAPFSNGPDGPVAFVPVTVTDGDVNDVRVAFAPGRALTGLVRVNDAPLTGAQARISLSPLGIPNLETGANVQDGGFTIKNLLPTRYRVALANLPNGYCMKTMRFGGVTLATPEIDGSAAGVLEIVLSDKPATVSGTVRDADGNGVADAQVHLWSTKDSEIRAARTSADGRYQFANLPPGDYRVIAWEWIENGAIENPALRAAFESQAAQFTLDEGTQQSADLKPVAKSAAEAAIARLP